MQYYSTMLDQYVCSCECRHCTLIEMLNSYGVKFSHTISTMLETYVVLPGVGSSMYATDVQLKLNYSCSEIELEPEWILSLRKSVTWNILQKLFTRLKSFLDPIWKQLDFLVYFHLYNSEVFSKYLKHQMTITSTSKYPVDICSIKIMLPLTGHQEFTKDTDEKIVQVLLFFACNILCTFCSNTQSYTCTHTHACMHT